VAGDRAGRHPLKNPRWGPLCTALYDGDFDPATFRGSVSRGTDTADLTSLDDLRDKLALDDSSSEFKWSPVPRGATGAYQLLPRGRRAARRPGAGARITGEYRGENEEFAKASLKRSITTYRCTCPVAEAAELGLTAAGRHAWRVEAPKAEIQQLEEETRRIGVQARFGS
jgi:hypothetical protein